MAFDLAAAEATFSRSTVVGRAQAALLATLANAAVDPPFALVLADQSLVIGEQPEVLNITRSQQPVRKLDEQMGLGEELAIIEWQQCFSVEWIVRGTDAAARRARFEAGLLAIGTTLVLDRTLGGNARGLVIDAPAYASHLLAEAPDTDAAAIPVWVTLRGNSYLE